MSTMSSKSPRIARSVRAALDTLKSAHATALDRNDDFDLDSYLQLVSQFLETSEAQLIKYAAKIQLFRTTQDELMEEIGRLGQKERELNSAKRAWNAERINLETEKEALQDRINELEKELEQIKANSNEEILDDEMADEIIDAYQSRGRRVTWADQMPGFDLLQKRNPLPRATSLDAGRARAQSDKRFEGYANSLQPFSEGQNPTAQLQNDDSEDDIDSEDESPEIIGNVNAGGDSIPTTHELYTITFRAAITEGLELSTARAGKVEVGQTVEIIETKETEDRIRGRLAKQKGWISIRSTCNRRWVWAKRLQSRWPS